MVQVGVDKTMDDKEEKETMEEGEEEKEEGNRVVEDFILLTQMNQSIYDYGSFGFWTAVLAGRNLGFISWIIQIGPLYFYVGGARRTVPLNQKSSFLFYLLIIIDFIVTKILFVFLDYSVGIVFGFFFCCL